MPIYDDTWENNDYAFRNFVQLRDLPKNHLGKLGMLKFEFIEYKANQQVACHLYQRMATHCYNQYGLIEGRKRPECLDAEIFFNRCVQINAFFGKLKRHYPEYFVNSGYSRRNVHFEELGL